jgi:cation-transporting ATPase E
VAATAALVSYGIARYGHGLSVLDSRTTATLVLIAVGLWVLVLQARPFNWWKTVLVAAMVASVAIIMAVPGLRDFYALQLPPANVVAEGAIIAGAAIALLEIGWRFSRVIGSRRNFDEVADDHAADEEALARASRGA